MEIYDKKVRLAVTMLKLFRYANKFINAETYQKGWKLLYSEPFI